MTRTNWRVLNSTVRYRDWPSNIWVPPIRNRIDMLATGIKAGGESEVAGTDLAVIDRITGELSAH